jgi:cell wall-associated NlpC family hydrolase
MKLSINFIVLVAECLVGLIVLAEIIHTTGVWKGVFTTEESSTKDGSHGAKWIIWGVIFTLALSLSPNKPQAFLPKSINNPSAGTPAKDLVATPHETATTAACFESSVTPEIPPPMKILPLEERFLLNPLTHPQPMVLLSSTDSESHNGQTLLARQHHQLKSEDLSASLMIKARYHLNTPYRMGGSLQTGNSTDCSGFVQYMYKKVDIELPRSSSEQAHEGMVAAHTMDFAKLIPGDLLFFSPGRHQIGHVGIYVGEGKMIHASNRRQRVIISDLRKPYYQGNFVVAKRVLKDKQYQ